MSETPAKHEAEGSEKFLLAEYGYLSESFWKNEETGEKRVNYLITLVTAVITAIVALATRQGDLKPGQIAWIALGACLALLAIGLLTFLRMIRRDEVTDEHKRALDDVRKRFRRRDATGLLDGYDPFPRQAGTRRRLGRGGLTELVAGVNSIVVAAGAAAVAARYGGVRAVAIAMAFGFAASFLLHMVYVDRRRKRARPHETESTLVVVSDEPETVIEAIAALRKLDGYRLRPRGKEEIRDLYFDSPDGKLRTARIALRVRQVGKRRLLTIKGPSRRGARGGESRLELEEEWPGRAWEVLYAELGRKLGIPAVAPVGADPAEALRSAGLVVVQDRRSSRQLRDVVPRDGTRRRVAELAIDSVVYPPAGHEVRHFEVEVEAKATGGESAVASLSESLVIRYWPALRPWRHGKLATGKAVAALLEERDRDDVLTDDGALRPSAYDAIADLLARERTGA